MVVPSYYHKFKCIASACKHSCCIGWEIDIDTDCAKTYRAVAGEMGARLKNNIAWEETPHFILGEGERCPFLNERNLCDLILNLGEESLCEICREHPRFYNILPDRTEAGLGLCCEEAARLILGEVECVTLLSAPQGEDEILAFRNHLIEIAQNRALTLRESCEKILKFCGKTLENLQNSAKILRDLERLDPIWDNTLDLLEKPMDFDGFDSAMAERSYEYEQFLVYLLYRHVASAFDLGDAKTWGAFAVLGCEILYRMGAAIWTESGEFSFEEQVELARMFSSEIEYSEENLDRIFEHLC